MNDANIWVFILWWKKNASKVFPHICNFLSSQRQIFQKFLQNLEFLGIACHSLTTQPSSGEVVFIQPELSDVSDLTWIKCPWMKPSSEVPAISDCKLELSSSWGILNFQKAATVSQAALLLFVKIFICPFPSSIISFALSLISSFNLCFIYQ